MSVTPAQRAYIKTHYYRMTNPELCLATGVSREGVRKIARRLGLAPKRVMRATADIDDILEAQQKRTQGWSIDRLSDWFGWSHTTACRVTAGYAPHKTASDRKPIVEVQKTRSAVRHCITCRDEFPSTHVGHRMCNQCRSRAGTEDSPYAV